MSKPLGQTLFKMNGFNLEKVVSKLSVVLIQKTNSKVLMMLKRFVKIFRLWLGLLQSWQNFHLVLRVSSTSGLFWSPKRSLSHIKNSSIPTFCNCINERTWTRCMDRRLGKRNFFYLANLLDSDVMCIKRCKHS